MYELDICVLYPDFLNLYGDLGNIHILQKRMEWRGHKVNIHSVSVGDVFCPEKYDMIFIGGGHDNGQKMIYKDFNRKAAALKETMEAGQVIFAVCAGFQLLGKFYDSMEDGKMEFSGLLDFYTENDSPRCRGDIIVKRDNGTHICGYENHSGRTYLGEGLKPFGVVEEGIGNNGKDSTEGVHYKNTFGTYCHGPILAASTAFADELLLLALEKKYGKVELEPLEDGLEKEAATILIKRYLDK